MSTFAAERVPRRRDDLVLLGLVLLLVVTGLAVLLTASYDRAEGLDKDGLFFLRKQLIAGGLGLLLAVPAARVPLRTIQRLIPIAVIGSLILALGVFLGDGSQGVYRWIEIGTSTFQPSELLKLTIVLYLASMMSRNRSEIDDVTRTLLPPFTILLVATVIVFLGNDFSTAMFIATLGLLMFFRAGVRLRYFLMLAIPLVPAGLIMLLTEEYRVNRIIAFLEPSLDPSGRGFHIRASRGALRAGGLWGAGIGAGTYKLGSLPEMSSDFVFAVAAEELGFVGVTGIIILFSVFAFFGYRVAANAKDPFRSDLAFGLTTAITFQALINFAVVVGVVPATGVPLPFFSAGGSSFLVTLVMCGLLLNVARTEGDAGGDVNG